MDSQKVFIPRGLINPNETAVIEIPSSFKEIPTVIAKKRSRDCEEDDDLYMEEYVQDIINENEHRKMYEEPPPFGDCFVARRSEPNFRTKSNENPDKVFSLDSNTTAFDNSTTKRTDCKLADLKENTRRGIVGTNRNLGNAAQDFSQPPHDRNQMFRSNVRPTLRMRNHFQNPPNGLQQEPQAWVQPGASPRPSNVIGYATQAFVQPIEKVLDKIDRDEYTKVYRDLERYQNARRRLIFDATKVASQLDSVGFEPAVL